MTRPIVYDLTHLDIRSNLAAPTGIDRVDFAYARHFASADDHIAAAAYYGLNGLNIVSASALGRVVDRASARWGETTPCESDVSFLRTRDWILGRAESTPEPGSIGQDVARYASVVDRRLRILSASLSGRTTPERALYLNVAQHRLEHGKHFEWLSARKDVRGVFFLHDLLPLDFPEYWPKGHEDRFARRVETILRHASALITASRSVRERVEKERDNRGQPPIPILSCPLPSAFERVDPGGDRDDDLAKQPYFVVVGTIEPRKNHLLLLNVWRRLVGNDAAAPKLVVIGSRGWENEQVIDMFERCAALHDSVRETVHVSSAGLRRLIANSRALLMPSFAEGFGLPIIEALGLGVPVIASDIPVFHEVSQERAVFCDAIDGLGWLQAVEAMSDPNSSLSLSAREAARQFVVRDEAGYFSTVREFLSGL
jgi:glycosyltransferase involved in cell wall biosynthesis